jgi:hypothetical protein
MRNGLVREEGIFSILHTVGATGQDFFYYVLVMFGIVGRYYEAEI